MAQWRLAKERGLKLLDITAKTGIGPFAPDFAIVMQYKRGEISEAEYSRLYLERMAASRERFPRHWETLKVYPEVAVACFCPPHQFCHRLLFIFEMETYLEKAGIEVIQRGELTLERIIEEQHHDRRTAGGL